MPKKQENLIETIIPELIGEEAVKLVKIMQKRKNISEFDLANMVKKDVNSVRNLLYKLFDHNLVSFTRKKDKKKGWYIYYCTLEEKRLPIIAKEMRQKKIEKIKDRIQREKSTLFYICPNKCVRLDFDQSANIQFKCPDCGTLMTQEDNSEKIRDLEQTLQGLEEKIQEKETRKTPAPQKKEPQTKRKTKNKLKLKKKTKKPKKKTKK